VAQVFPAFLKRMTRKQQIFLILILGALSTVSPFSIDMYLPGFPAIAKDLDTTIASVQLSLTSYFIGIAAGQILYGPLLDRFGRKVPLYGGLTIYIAASFACAFTNSVESLIVMRFLQALGGCGGMVAAQTLVRDLFPVNKTAQAFSWITLVVAVSPMIAPTVGGYITVAFGWHAMFILLAAIAIIILAGIYFVLPQGRKPDPTISLKPKAVLKNFYQVIQQPQFLIYALAGGVATSAPFAFIAGSADVFINQYKVSEKQYGWIFAIIAGVIIASTQLNHILLKKYKSEDIVKAALCFQTAVGVFLLTGTVYEWFDKIAMIVFIALFLAGHGLTNPNANALSLAPFSRHTGSAASLLGSFRMMMGGIVSGLVSAFYTESAVPMIAVMVGCIVCGLLILFTGKTTIKYKARKKDVENETSGLI
jgi:DHA1 family bicyclomycin/chloramphenicol resistance-like MFS transporter